ncbi:MAG TPA: ChaN family lipoprotein [Hyphomicrobiaceae bacterium]|nr:ChaN family lipoprotein [Hyphomicrobiaceae bacterium]
MADRLRLRRRLQAGLRIGLALSALAAAGGMARAESPPPAGLPPGFQWSSSGLRDHPLVGRLWSTATRSFVSLAAFEDAMGRATFVLLGEVHDNPDAHALQGWAVSARAKRQPLPGVVFEHITTRQQSALDELDELKRSAGRPATPDDLFRLLEWKKGSWPSEDVFAPLFSSVLAANVPIYPASPPREQVRAVARGDQSQLSEGERVRLQLDAPMPQDLEQSLATELRGSHCGAIPEQAIGPMAIAQRYRDAAFADAMLAAADKHGVALLIAGNGHVRTDRGVPWHLRARAPDKPIVSIMFLEVEEGRLDPDAYLPHDPAGKAAADFALFTPRVERGDPCEGMTHPRKKG